MVQRLTAERVASTRLTKTQMERELIVSEHRPVTQ